MASPVAASVAGLMKSLHPEWMVEQIHTMIVATADPVIYEVNTEEYIQGKLGSGRVDALKAITTELFPKIELVDMDILRCKIPFKSSGLKTIMEEIHNVTNEIE